MVRMNGKKLKDYVGSKWQLDEDTPYVDKWDEFLGKEVQSPNFVMKRRYKLYLQDKSCCEDWNKIFNQMWFIEHSLELDPNYVNSNAHIYDTLYALKLIKKYHNLNNKLKYEVIKPKMNFTTNKLEVEVINCSSTFCKLDYMAFKKEVNEGINELINIITNILKA